MPEHDPRRCCRRSTGTTCSRARAGSIRAGTSRTARRATRSCAGERLVGHGLPAASTTACCTAQSRLMYSAAVSGWSVCSSQGIAAYSSVKSSAELDPRDEPARVRLLRELDREVDDEIDRDQGDRHERPPARRVLVPEGKDHHGTVLTNSASASALGWSAPSPPGDAPMPQIPSTGRRSSRAGCSSPRWAAPRPVRSQPSLVAQGQLARDQMAAAVDELVEMSRARSEERARAGAERGAAPAERARPGDARPIWPGSNAARGHDGEERDDAQGAREEDGGQEGAAKKAAKKPRRRSPAVKRAERVRRRLDVELVRRGLVPSRTGAADAIDEGRVLVGGAPATTAARQVGDDEPITVHAPTPGVRVARWVQARGRARRLRARRHGRACGRRRRRRPVASPTACCSAAPRTSSRSTSVAVSSRGRLRTDERVTVMERTNVRDLTADALDDNDAEVLVADLSFISLRTVAPNLLALAAADADFVLLVKPQFEAGRARVGRGGIVRDPAVHEAVSPRGHRRRSPTRAWAYARSCRRRCGARTATSSSSSTPAAAPPRSPPRGIEAAVRAAHDPPPSEGAQ